jgi:hypothetical protein
VAQPDAGHLRRSAGEVARLLLLFCGANTYGPFGDPDGFNAAETVSLLLDGLLKRDDEKRRERDPLRDAENQRVVLEQVATELEQQAMQYAEER